MEAPLLDRPHAEGRVVEGAESGPADDHDVDIRTGIHERCASIEEGGGIADVHQDAAGTLHQHVIGVLLKDEIALSALVREGDAFEASGGRGGEGVAEADTFDGGNTGAG
jgi:hypothetical protein